MIPSSTGFTPVFQAHERAIALLMALYGQGKTRGKVAVLGIDATTNQACAGIELANSVSHEFVFYFLVSRYDQIRGLSNSGSQENLSGSLVKSIDVPLPPTLAEQEAIAEALGDADSLVESLERLLAKKRYLKQAAMQQLLTGKKRLPGFEGNWATRRFGEIAFLRNLRVDPRRNNTADFCIELEHIEQGTGRLLGHTRTQKDAALKSVFTKGDVLFGKLRAYLRKYWLATRDGVCSTEIWVLAANVEIATPEFLNQLVRTESFIDVASTAYGTHMPRSDWGVVQNHQVLVPIVEEQTAIAKVLSDMDEEILAIESKIEKAQQIKQGMMQELLTGRTRLV